MGYHCAVDLKHYDGAPAKVVTKVRKVIFINDFGVSEGLETVEEVMVHPDNVEALGEPIIVGEVKEVDARSPKARRRDERRKSQDKPSYLETWKDYQREQAEKKAQEQSKKQ